MKNDLRKRILKKIKEAEVKQLEKLDLSCIWRTIDEEKLTEVPEEVFKLKNLKILNLGNNNLANVPESIGSLSNLISLDLKENRLIDLPESIGNLSNLTSLYLRDNRLISLPESIGNLSNLTSLYLEVNQLTSLPESIGNLSNLISLYLRVNQLTSLPESIGNLSNLISLELQENQLTSLPESIGNISTLTTLYLDRNRLRSLPESIGNLSTLISLHLSINQLKSIPKSISNLSTLTNLNLLENNLKILPKSIGNLSNLLRLDLRGNQLANLPESISKLSNLTNLYLDKNQLKSLPESIGDLSNLFRLDLDGNRLTNLPENITKLSKLKELSIRNNPLDTPPIEIANKGIEDIREYFRQLKEEGREYIYEAKLLIVGEAGAGKTTLANKIHCPVYKMQDNQASTEGIDVIKWSFPLLEKEREFKVNIWDFGGQEIYHATHQFFLTKRSLYTLVVDSRKEDTDFYYWLNLVELLSDNSPLLIIKNEKQDRKRDINERALRGQFTNLAETLATNLKTNRGLEEIITNVKHYIVNLPHIGQTLPKTWVKVRLALESDPRNYISLQEYFDICETNGFTRLEDKLQLSDYLHDLGVCLHFQDEEDSLLYRTVILKPEWGTDAVYKVLDSKQVVNNKGCFNCKDLKNIWQEEKYASMRGELLELMKKFQLCYKIPNSKDTFISPQLLSDNQPEYDWDEANNLILRYAYPDFMPKGIISRFIVSMHQYIEEQKFVWKTGVILKKDNTRAEVIENYGKREIRIRVIGDNKRNFLTIVSHEIDKINDSYKRLKYQKLIPCNCNQCKDSQSPQFYSFEILKKFLVDNKYSIQCQANYNMVNVLSLIDDVVDLNKLINENKQPNNQLINIERLNSISGNFQELLRIIMMDSGNYSEYIRGDYSEQKGDKNSMTNITQTHSGSGDNVARDKNITNNYNSQDLTQAAKDIKALLKQLEETNPTKTTSQKMAVGLKLTEEIENNPTRWQKVINVIKAMGIEALAEAVDNPIFNIAKAGVEAALESE